VAKIFGSRPGDQALFCFNFRSSNGIGNSFGFGKKNCKFSTDEISTDKPNKAGTIAWSRAANSSLRAGQFGAVRALNYGGQWFSDFTRRQGFAPA